VKALVLRAERLYLAESTLGLSDTSSSSVPFSSLFTEVRGRGILRSSGMYSIVHLPFGSMPMLD
jgi:hypothetical protein